MLRLILIDRNSIDSQESTFKLQYVKIDTVFNHFISIISFKLKLQYVKIDTSFKFKF